MIIKTDRSEFESYLHDASNFSGSCNAVYFPESASDISDILKSAQASGTEVTVSGNGTGVTGGRVPQGGIVLSVEKLNAAPVFNEFAQSVLVSAGFLLGDFMSLCIDKQLFYPPDPTEKNCFIGATIATNASGARTYGYGSTRAFVNALEIVLPDGELLKLRRGETFAHDGKLVFHAQSGKEYLLELPDVHMPPVKNAAGYFIQPNMDAIDLFIGSEGTLGVITKAELRLLPKPESTLSAVIFFPNEDDAFQFTEALKSGTVKRLSPRSIEFFDGNSLRFLSQKFPRIPASANGAVWFEQDCTHDAEEELLQEWIELITAHNGMEDAIWFAFDETDAAEIHAFRHAISYMVNEYISKHGLRKLGTDAAVPDARFREFYTYCKNAVAAEGIGFVLYGHFGNSHPHLNMLPTDEVAFQKGKLIYEAICRKAVSLGGTVSAEHGIGKFKRNYLRLLYPAKAIRGMAAIKKVLDPGLILNHGNIFFDDDFTN